MSYDNREVIPLRDAIATAQSQPGIADLERLHASTAGQDDIRASLARIEAMLRQLLGQPVK